MCATEVSAEITRSHWSMTAADPAVVADRILAFGQDYVATREPLPGRQDGVACGLQPRTD